MLVNAGILNAIGENVDYRQVEIQPQGEEVIVNLKASSLNRRDLWIQEGKYAKIRLPFIPGSDGAGQYEGRDVLLLPTMHWGNSQAFQSMQFEILGMPHHGCCAEKIAVLPSLIYPMPGHLEYHEAAALPLSGLTAWRALMTQAQAKPGQKILITGVGGGVASFVLQFAVAHGMDVYVTSGTDEKINLAKSLGAKGGANYRSPDAYSELQTMVQGFDVIIDSAGGQGFQKLLKLANFGAHVVIYGGTLGNMDGINPQNLFWKQLTIKGSTMGTPEEFSDMLHFINKHKVKPIIDRIFPLQKINEAFDYMRSGNHFGKIIIHHT